jgi:hypothetical protein
MDLELSDHSPDVNAASFFRPYCIRPRPACQPAAGEPFLAAVRIDKKGDGQMAKFLLWLILLVICWPIALMALLLFPIVWLLLIPFRLLGITVNAVLDLFKAVITLPARLLRGPART